MTALLPMTTHGWDGCDAACPHCGGDPGAAEIPLARLARAHLTTALRRPRREADGAADPEALTAACPACAGAFMVALRSREAGGGVELTLALIPVRAA